MSFPHFFAGTFAATLPAPIAQWVSLQTQLKPSFNLFFSAPQIGDVVTLKRGSDTFTDTIDSLSPIALDFDTGDWDQAIHSVSFMVTRGASFSNFSSALTVLISLDVTAPVLSSMSASEDGETAYTASVTTDEGNGYIHRVATRSTTPPSGTQIIAGEDENGDAAEAVATPLLVTTIGAKDISSGGLAGGTGYHIYAVHRDAAGNISNVISSTEFTTEDTTAPVISLPVAAATASTRASGGFTTNEALGDMYGVITTSVTPPTEQQIIDGEDHTGSPAADAVSQAVGATAGAKTFTGGFDTLTPSTAYRLHGVQEDAFGNRSNVVTSAEFTTNPAITFVPSTDLPNAIDWDFNDLDTMWGTVTGTTTLVGATGGESVGQVDDLAGNFSFATPLRALANDGARPTYVAGGGLRFTPASLSYLRAILTTRYTGTAMYAWIVVTPGASMQSASRILSFVDNAAPTHDYDVGDVCSFLYRDGANLKGYRLANKSSASWTAGVRAIYGSYYDGTNHTLYKDGVAQTPVASTGAMDANQFLVGSLAGLSNSYAHMDIDRIIIALGDPSSDDVDDVWAYLEDKYP